MTIFGRMNRGWHKKKANIESSLRNKKGFLNKKFLEIYKSSLIRNKTSHLNNTFKYLSRDPARKQTDERTTGQTDGQTDKTK